jgi:predicted TIM-barrel fold metal-dependent hydrolase
MMFGTIDVHTHFLTGALISALDSRSDFPRISRSRETTVIEYGPGNARQILAEMIDFDAQQEERRRRGISRSVLSTNIPGVDWLPDHEAVVLARAVNDEMAQLIDHGNGPDTALAVLPMNVPEMAAEELERAVRMGLSGAMFYSNVAGSPLDVLALAPLFDTAAALDVPIAIHPTYPLSAKSLEDYALIPGLGFLVDTTTVALRLILGGVYEGRESLKLVLHHAGSLLPQIAGRIDYEAMLHGARGAGRLEVKPSERIALLYTDTVCAWEPALRSALDLFGADHVMFGSDYPFWSFEPTATLLDQMNIDEPMRSAIEFGNAEAVYPGLVQAAR